MLGTFVDIENELSDIANEVEMLRAGVAIFARDSDQADSAWAWLAIQGLASGVEKIYSGCERVMAIIASEIDGGRIEHSEGWHVSLLKRMANPFPEIREAVITDDTYKALDLLRAFRDRERNTYGLVLDSGIVLERAKQTLNAFERFRRDVTALARKMSASR